MRYFMRALLPRLGFKIPRLPKSPEVAKAAESTSLEVSGFWIALGFKPEAAQGSYSSLSERPFKPLATALALGLTLLILLTPFRAAQAQGLVPRFEPDACPFPERADIQCGWLITPEDHRQPEGTTIRLAVAILKSNSPAPQSDPILFLNGGPGSAVVASTLELTGLFSTFVAQRDVILLDQRGAGLSQPALDCPGFAALAAQPLSREARLAEGRRLLSDCRSRLEGQGIHVAAYNSAQNAADVADLRAALGLEQVNLLGVSYGTELALTVMRDHPQGIRSVILDSTKPPQEALYAQSAANFERAFQTMADTCAADILCRLAYPNLLETYTRLVDRLNASPATIHFDLLGRSLDVQVSGDMLADLVLLMLYDPTPMVYVPALIDSLNRGEYDALKTMPLGAGQGMAESISYGMFFATMCSEDATIPLNEAQGTAAFDSTIFGSTGFSLCQAWGIPSQPQAENAPVASDIPTLVLAGQFDPVTPPGWGQEAAQSLSHSVFVEFPGLGHSVISASCPMSIAAAFLDHPDAAPDAACVGSLRPPQFILTAPATRPLVGVGAALLSGLALWMVGNAGAAFRRNPRQVAWRAALRTVGWIAPAVTAGVLLLLILPEDTHTMFPWADRTRIVEAIVPLAMAVQAALLLSPDDEPALEVLLACPRRISWLLLERLAAMLITEAGIALVGVALTLALKPDQNVGLALVRWIPPAIFLSGIGVYVTLRSRVAAFGLVCAGLVWFALIFFGASLLPGQPVMWPLNTIQPLLWPLNAYLQPGDLSSGDYWLNRLFVTAAGLNLIALAVYQLRDEEQVLLGAKNARRFTRKHKEASS